MTGESWSCFQQVRRYFGCKRRRRADSENKKHPTQRESSWRRRASTIEGHQRRSLCIVTFHVGISQVQWHFITISVSISNTFIGHSKGTRTTYLAPHVELEMSGSNAADNCTLLRGFRRKHSHFAGSVTLTQGSSCVIVQTLEPQSFDCKLIADYQPNATFRIHVARHVRRYSSLSSSSSPRCVLSPHLRPSSSHPLLLSPSSNLSECVAFVRLVSL